MNFRKTLLSVAVYCSACFCVVSCSSPKEQYIREYTRFAETTLAEFEHYNSQERDMALEQYAAFREESELYENEFSREEQELIKDYNRQLNAIITKKYLDDGIRKVGGYVEEIQGLLEDILGM